MDSATTEPAITDHVFRMLHVGNSARSGKLGGPRLDPGMCWWNGTCNRPEGEHITVAEYRRRKDGGTT